MYHTTDYIACCSFQFVMGRLRVRKSLSYQHSRLFRSFELKCRIFNYHSTRCTLECCS